MRAWLCSRREGRIPSDCIQGAMRKMTSRAIIQIAEEQRVALMPLTSTIMANLNAITLTGRHYPTARALHVVPCCIAPCPFPSIATGSPLAPYPGRTKFIFSINSLCEFSLAIFMFIHSPMYIIIMCTKIILNDKNIMVHYVYN